jgi:N-acetylneuraminate synthase
VSKIFYIAEAGINHNGDINIAKRIIDIAIAAGADAVKFQKRDPLQCVPEEQKNIMKETPWGVMSYLDYKKRIEFGEKEYDEIDRYCKDRGIEWFCSTWDIDSQHFLRKYNLKYNKIASAMLTYEDLLEEVSQEQRHTFISTGMSSMVEIENAIDIFRKYSCPFTIMHCTSTYPCVFEEVNLNMIKTLRNLYPDSIGVGFSDHTKGILAGPVAVSLGATVLEKHITNDRSAYGSDQANSLEEKGIKSYIRDCNNVAKILGSGVKVIYTSEEPIRKKLRKF